MSFLTIETCKVPPLPDQSKTPFWDQQWIDPALHKLLFDGPDFTYLVVDSTLRRKITKYYDLDVLDVPVRCLFQGKAADSLAESAPYLIDLTLDGDNIPGFHKSFFIDHWTHGTGILLRSGVSMDRIWKHLRKFTKSNTETGPDQFFRLWETNTVVDYFESVSSLGSRAKDLFQIKPEGWISLIVNQSKALDRTSLIRPVRSEIETAQYSDGLFRLSPPEEAALLRGVLRCHAKKIEQRVAFELPLMPPAVLEARVFEAVEALYAEGMRDGAQISARVVEALGKKVPAA